MSQPTAYPEQGSNSSFSLVVGDILADSLENGEVLDFYGLYDKLVSSYERGSLENMPAQHLNKNYTKDGMPLVRLLHLVEPLEQDSTTKSLDFSGESGESGEKCGDARALYAHPKIK